jgi:3D (Asp-Asp-Asp) domain-containing protein
MTKLNPAKTLPYTLEHRAKLAVASWLLLTILLLYGAGAALADPKSMKVRVTFYSPGSRSRTATGRSARLPGVAVDPRVIPLGSKVSVPGFGVRVADDTGGAIKGRRIDVRLPVGSHARARKHGVKHLRVHVTRPSKHKKHTKSKR